MCTSPSQIAEAFFSQNKQCCGFGQCAILTRKLAFQVFYPLFFFLGRTTKTSCTRAVPVISLFASSAPRGDLRRIKAAFAAVFGEVSLVQRSGFQHRCELVT